MCDMNGFLGRGYSGENKSASHEAAGMGRNSLPSSSEMMFDKASVEGRNGIFLKGFLRAKRADSGFCKRTPSRSPVVHKQSQYKAVAHLVK